MANRGFGLLEVVIAVAIVAIFFWGLMNGLTSAVRLNQRNLRMTQASFLLNEGVEAVKMLRNSGWQAQIVTLTNNVPYRLHWSGTTWQATSTPLLIDSIFDRRFVLSDAYRDGNQDLASSGSVDSGTRKLTVTVSWRDHSATTTATSTTYITDLFSN